MFCRLPRTAPGRRADPREVGRVQPRRMVQCSEFPALVMSYGELLAQPKATVLGAGRVHRGLWRSVTGGMEDAVRAVERLSSGAPVGWGRTGHRGRAVPGTESGPRSTGRASTACADGDGGGDDLCLGGCHVELLRRGLLRHLLRPERRTVSTETRSSGWTSSAPWRPRSSTSCIPRTVARRGLCHGNAGGSAPRSGRGCPGHRRLAMGHRPGPRRARPFCKVGSITEEIDGSLRPDHVFRGARTPPPSLRRSAVANLCRHSDAVLFSSTPTNSTSPPISMCSPVATGRNCSSAGVRARRGLRCARSSPPCRACSDAVRRGPR